MLPLDVFGTSAEGGNLTLRGKFCGMKSSYANLLSLKQMFVRKISRTVSPPLIFYNIGIKHFGPSGALRRLGLGQRVKKEASIETNVALATSV